MAGRLNIVFMGTPDFAVDSLEAVYREGYPISAVVTVPDKPAGRGQSVRPSAIKQKALQLGLPLLQPDSLKDPGFIGTLRSLEADLFIVVAFRILPVEVWSMPPQGTFNLHASLLPQYRGAAPMNWAIINGEVKTGLTTFFLDKNIDTGKVIFRETLDIGENETAGELHDRMKKAGAGLVIKTLKAIEKGTASTLPQEELAGDFRELRKAPKITKEDCQINWQADAHTIHNFIRGLSPVPGAFTQLLSPEGVVHYLKIFRSVVAEKDGLKSAGSLETDGKSYLRVSTNDGSLGILDLQVAGKKRMGTGEFLRGFRINSTWKIY